MKKLTDIEIIASIKKGNHSDFSLLIDRYKNKAFSLSRRMLQNEMDAEEAVQDSFLKAFNSLESFREESKFSTWFYKIVYNTALTMISNSKRKTNRMMSSVDDHLDLSNNDDQIYAESENAKQYLYKLVNLLPPKHGLVLILFYIDELSLNEISTILDISIVNTKVILHRSRNALKDLIIKHNYQEELR